MTRTLLLYLYEKNAGNLGPLLDDLPVDEAYLMDIHNWISHDTAKTLFARLVTILGDDRAIYNMARSTARFGSLGLLDEIIRKLGSPKRIFLNAPKYNLFFKTISTISVHEAGSTWVLLEDRHHAGYERTWMDCDYARGIFASVPQLFGLPPAQVEEIQCQVPASAKKRRDWPDAPIQGSPECRYRISWKPFRRKYIFSRLFPRRNTEDHAVTKLELANQEIQTKYDQIRKMAADLEAANLELKRQKARLADSERRYRYLFENGSDVLCVHDLNGVLLETNIPFKKEYGWHRDELEGVNIRDLLPGAYKPKFDAYLERIQAQGADEGYIRIRAHSGKPVTLEYRNQLLIDESGKPFGVYGAARDVTHRVLYEKALKEGEEKYRELLKFAPAGILEIDLSTGQIINVNDIIGDYTGYTENELRALANPLDLLDAASQKAVLSLLEANRLSQSETAAIELEFNRKDGKSFFVIVNFRFFYEKGQQKRILTVVHDITTIKLAELEKKNLEVKLANAKRLESLGTLAGGVAHDLNNILSGIVSYPDLLLLDLPEGHPLRQPLLTIKNSGEKASEIVQDLLTLARRNVGSKKIVRLNRLIQDFMTSPEYEKILENRPHIQVMTDIQKGELSVMGSSIHILKTLMNLVSNAVDALPSGGQIRISTRDQYIDTPRTGFELIPKGEYAVLEVSDDGIGISAADVEKIFEPFYTKKVMGRSGSGLGMSVVWGTVKDHDGCIDIITQEGAGTTFVLYFAGTRSSEDTDTSVHIDDYLGNGESILVIDDAAEQRDLACRMMKRLGYTVYTAASGEEAITMVTESDFDLLVLDMIMPGGMNGLETYMAILKQTPGQRAIIASGYAETEDVHKAQRLGAGAYIKKPYSLEKIGMAVRTELARKRLSGPS